VEQVRRPTATTEEAGAVMATAGTAGTPLWGYSCGTGRAAAAAAEEPAAMEVRG